MSKNFLNSLAMHLFRKENSYCWNSSEKVLEFFYNIPQFVANYSLKWENYDLLLWTKNSYLIWINCVNRRILVYRSLLLNIFKHSLCQLIIKSGKWSTSLVWSLRSNELDSKTLNDSQRTIHWMVIIHLHKDMALKTYIYTH
jgi:hypothetical protein